MKVFILACLMATMAHADTLITNKDGTTGRVVGDMVKIEILAESASGAVIPPASFIVDANLNKWSVVAGAVQKNDLAAGFTANVTTLLYFKKTIYQQNNAGGWWSWDGTTWVNSTDPRIVAPPPPPPPPTGTIPPVFEPVAGATKGTWKEGTLGGMAYAYMLPHGYDGSKSYPLMLFLHQLQNDAAIPAQIDPWFNTSDFRARHPAIVIAPRCTDSGEARNWGGVSSASQVCGDLAVAIVKEVIAHYPVQTNRVYVTGDSMGGIGSWDMIIRFPTTFAATFILAGATYDHDLNTSAALLKNFPIWAIHGANDTSVPLDWERNIKPLVNNMQYEVWAGYGHDVWDDAYPQATHMDWMFAQKRAVTPPPVVVTPPPAAGRFKVVGGQIMDPDGKIWIAHGINLGDPSPQSQLTKLFPGINFIRYAIKYGPDSSTFKSFIDAMTQQKIVVEIENHPWPLVNAYTGQELTNEINWYIELAAAYKGNPYVWFGTMNEPQGGDITAEQVATYNAIRGTGADNILLMEAGVGGGNPGLTGPPTLKTASYASMRNVAFDLHFYGWTTNFNTDQNIVNAKLLGAAGTGTGIRALQEIKSADGIIPVMNAEFGVSTASDALDANANQDVFAVTNWAIANKYTVGFAGWHWNADSFNALQSNGVLTVWGKQLAAAIAQPAVMQSFKVQSMKKVKIKKVK